MQTWNKKGLLFDFTRYDAKHAYATAPVGFWLTPDILRVIFSSRNKNNQSIPYLIDYDFHKKQIVSPPVKIELELGELGAFDDSGIMPTCLVQKNNQLWLYYIGWNLGVTVPFRNSVGLAISEDNGLTFKKMFKGPILDRTKDEPHFVASNSVLKENNIYKMWYLSCSKWEKTNNTPKHYYHIKYATSVDGITWDRNGIIAIDFLYENEYAISVPRVIKEGAIYKMWYSYRGGPKGDSYRIGYAESNDGIIWKRKDEQINMDVSLSGWDKEMICYPFIFDYNGTRYMLYNGNGYGKSGFGLAELINQD